MVDSRHGGGTTELLLSDHLRAHGGSRCAPFLRCSRGVLSARACAPGHTACSAHRDVACPHCAVAVTTEDGHSYERAAIEFWLRDHSTSPKTGARLQSTALVAAHSLRNAIEEWQQANCKLIPRSALTFRDPQDQIGVGSFKRVFKAALRLPGSPRATTVAALQVRDGDVAEEAAVLLKLGKHPRLVTFIGQCRSVAADLRSDIILITEFAPMGSLDQAIEDVEDEITLQHKVAIMMQVASGMEALAGLKLIHRDLATRNVLVFGLDMADVTLTSVKVSDFGLTVNTYTATHKYVQGGDLPVRYLALESLKKGRYSEQSDVWAFGVMCWELLTNGDIPYFEISNDDAVVAHVVGGGTLARPAGEYDCPDGLWGLVASCWAKKPKDRPEFTNLGILLAMLQMQVGDATAVPSQQRKELESTVVAERARVATETAAELNRAKEAAEQQASQLRKELETSRAAAVEQQRQVKKETARIAKAENLKAASRVMALMELHLNAASIEARSGKFMNNQDMTSFTLLCLPGMTSAGSFECHKLPRVVAVRPLPVPPDMVNRWGAHAAGKLQSWAWHGTNTRCVNGMCMHPSCGLCSITRSGFRVDLSDKENEIVKEVGQVIFLAFSAAHAAVFAESSEAISSGKGRRIVMLSKVVTGIDIIADLKKHDICKIYGTGKYARQTGADILANRSPESCWYGGQLPSGPGTQALISWKNENILPLYAVEIEPREPYKTRDELAMFTKGYYQF